MIHPLTNTYTTAAQRDKEQLLHTKSLQLPENKGLQTFRKTVECIVTVPSVSFETQVDENNKEIILKKLSTEIIMGKTTEDTAMELDAEGGASFEQLQDLVKKEYDKRDKKYRSLEQKYNKLHDSVDTTQPQKNLQTRGQRGASNKKKLPMVSRRPVPNQRGRPTTTKRQPHTALPRSLAGRQGKADDNNKNTTNDNPIKSKGNRRSRPRQKKGLLPPIGPNHDCNHKQNKTIIWFRRGSKENTTTQRLFHTRNHPNLVLFLQAISPSISRLHTTKTASKKPTFTAGVGIKIYTNTSLHKHMDQTQRNLHAQTSTSYSLMLSFRRNSNFL